MDCRAVSEVVGAMLTLVVIISAAGIIYMMSYPTILGGIDDIAYRNAIKNMVETKELVERMKFGNEVATTKVIQLGGSVYTAYSTNLTINDNGERLKSLVFEVSGKKIFLESGIFEEIQQKVIPIPISEPSIAITEDTAYFTFYNFLGNFSAGGSKVTINLVYNGTEIRDASELEIESKSCEIWKEALEKAIGEFSYPPISFEDDDCSDQMLKVSGNITIVLVNVEVR